MSTFGLLKVPKQRFLVGNQEKGCGLTAIVDQSTLPLFIKLILNTCKVNSNLTKIKKSPLLLNCPTGHVVILMSVP